MKGLYPDVVYHKSVADTDAEIRAEQLNLLYRAVPLSLAVNMTVSLVLVVVNWQAVPHAMLLGWWSALLVLTLWRAWVLSQGLQQQRRKQRGNDAYWERRLSVGIVSSAALWGLSSWLLFPLDSPLHQSFVTIVLVGLTGGAVTTLSGHRSNSALMSALILLPLAARWFTLGGETDWVLGGLILFLAVIIFLSALRVRRTLVQNIVLRLEAAAREQDLRDSEVRFQRLFESSPLGLAQFDTRGVVQTCNDALCRIVGAPREVIVGFNLLEDSRDAQLKVAVQRALEDGSADYEGVYESITVDKSTPVRGLLTGLPAADGGFAGGLAIVEDITEQRDAQREIERQALYDPLTELPNRRLLLDQIEHELARARRHQHRGALLFLDLDHFKTINDSLGHAVGDQLLQHVAQRLGDSLRGEDTAARLGGDEFVVLLSDLDSDLERALANVRLRAEGLNRILSSPYRVEGHDLHVSASIGVSMLPNEYQSADALLQHADAAMYEAKSQGRNTVRFFHKALQEAADSRMAIEKALRQATRRDELKVYYQAQVDAQGKLIGAEALLRWQHPQRGLISPAEFIPIAEEVGLVTELGEWILEQVCEWLQRQSPSRPLPVSLNISPRQFQQEDFVARVTRIIERYGTDPACIEMEITEGVLLEKPEQVADKMRQLQALGIRFAIDDFGTGYSSLGYLKTLPVNRLKIDQSFVRDVPADVNDAAIIETILAMASHLGLSTVAEGVETREQLDFLRSRGCVAFQGYYFGYPVPAKDFAELAQHHPATG